MPQNKETKPNQVTIWYLGERLVVPDSRGSNMTINSSFDTLTLNTRKGKMK